jgi:hypothetical protein
MEVDHIIIDLPSGADPVFAGLFALSDLPILVARPDAGSLWAATQALRAALFHAIAHHPSCCDAEEELRRLLRDQALRMDRSTLAAPYLTPIAHRVIQETQRSFVPNLVLTHADPEADRPLSDALCVGWRHLLGVHPRPMAIAGPRPRGGTPESDAVTWAQSLAERILSLPTYLLEHPRPAENILTPAGILGLPDATPNDILRDGLATLAGTLETDMAKFVAAMGSDAIQELLGTIVDQRNALDEGPVPGEDIEGPEETVQLSLSPLDEPSQATPTNPMDEVEEPEEVTAEVHTDPPDTPAASRPKSTDPARVHKPLLPDHPPTGDDNPGARLRRLRRKEDLSLRELSLRTKIGVKYLDALEKMDRANLPRTVYVRGYLREIATVYDIPEGPLLERYFEFLGRP